jgi:erythromycin esterase
MTEATPDGLQDNLHELTGIINWLKGRAVPVVNLEAGHSLEDLMPLKDILKDARLVGLGEATHGTREFFQFKHRLVEFLAKEMDFTVFALEASYAACVKINDYVLYGQGDPAKALAGQGFWTWDTEEILDMIKWMREYNLTQPDSRKIRFYGYDVQNVNIAIDLVLDYVSKVAPEYSEKASLALSAVSELQRDPHSKQGNTDPARKAEAVQRLYELVGILGMHRSRFIRKTSTAEFTQVLQNARVCLQYMESYGKPVSGTDGFMLRDLYMAENIEYIAKCVEPEAKIAVWAHNGHIFTGQYLESIKSMGGLLREMFSDEYYALGFSFFSGKVQSRDFSDPDVPGDLEEFSVPASRPGTVDWCLAETGIDNFIVDFRRPEIPPEARLWLETPRPMKSIGAGYIPDSRSEDFDQLVSPNCYDGLVFISRSSRARPTPTGMRKSGRWARE